MPIKKIKFPDGTVRRVKVREGQTREEIREKVMAAYESEVASQDPDLPFASNIQDAEARAEAQRGPAPGIWERASAIADAGLTMGQNAIGGAVMAPFANAQALANSVTRGDFGTYEGARRTQQEAGERTGRYMSDTVTPFSDNPELTRQYLDAADPFLASLEAGVPGMAGRGGRVPRNVSEARLGTQMTPGQVTRALPGGDAVANGVNRAREGVGNFVEQRAQNKAQARNPGAAGADRTLQDRMELEAARERNERAKALGLEGDAGLTVGQLTRNLDAQAQEGALRTMGGAQVLQTRADNQNAALQGNIDRSVAEVGAGPDGDYRPMLDVDVGGKVKTALRDAEEASRKDYQDAYDRAENSPEINMEVSNEGLGSLFDSKEWKPIAIGAPTKKAVSGFNEYLEASGIGQMVDGKLVLRNATIGELEDLRRQVPALFDMQDAPQKRAGAKIIDAIDEQLDGVEGGELFKDARARRRRHAEEYDEHDFVSRVLGMKGRTSADKIPDEKVAQGVRGLSNAELGRLKTQLIGQGEDGGAAWRQVSSSILQQMHDKAKLNSSRGTDGEARLNTETLANSIAELDSAGKLDMLFGKEVANRLRMLVTVSRDVNQPVRGTVSRSGSDAGAAGRQAIERGFKAIIATKIPVIGPMVVEQVSNRRNRKQAETMLDGEGMLQRAAN
jgi:hypothetical protein